jgi:hypothetical protein
MDKITKMAVFYAPFVILIVIFISLVISQSMDCTYTSIFNFLPTFGLTHRIVILG